MDCSLPGSSVHWIFQARVLEWVAIAFSENFITFKYFLRTKTKSKWCHSMKCQLLIWGMKPRIQILEQDLSIKLRLQNHCGGDYSNEIKRHFLLGRIAMSNLDSVLKSRDIGLPAKIRIVTAMVFPVVTHGCVGPLRRLSSVNCRFRTVELDKTLESPLDSKEIKWVNPKGNQSWIFIRRTEAETPIFWPPDVKSQFMWKDPDVGKDWRQEEKGTTEDEMVVWYHWLDGHEFVQTQGDSDGQRNLAFCSSQGCRVRHSLVTEQQQQPGNSGGQRSLACCSPWCRKELDLT